MYSGILMIGPRLVCVLGTWLVPLAATVMFTVLARRTRIEEAYLIARFGDRFHVHDPCRPLLPRLAVSNSIRK